MKFFSLPCMQHRQTRAAVATIHNPGATRVQLDDAERRLDRFEAKHAATQRSCALGADVRAARLELVTARRRLTLGEMTFTPLPSLSRATGRKVPRTAQLGAVDPNTLHTRSTRRIGPRSHSPYAFVEGAWSSTQLMPAPRGGRVARPRSPSLELRRDFDENALYRPIRFRPDLPPFVPPRGNSLGMVAQEMEEMDSDRDSVAGSFAASLASWDTFGVAAGKRPT